MKKKFIVYKTYLAVVVAFGVLLSPNIQADCLTMSQSIIKIGDWEISNKINTGFAYFSSSFQRSLQTWERSNPWTNANRDQAISLIESSGTETRRVPINLLEDFYDGLYDIPTNSCSKKNCGRYNTRTEICCNGVVNWKGLELEELGLEDWNGEGLKNACCGMKAYNTKIEICCNGVVDWKGLKNACCGMKAYYTKIEICCNGVADWKGFNYACW